MNRACQAEGWVLTFFVLARRCGIVEEKLCAIAVRSHDQRRLSNESCLVGVRECHIIRVDCLAFALTEKKDGRSCASSFKKAIKFGDQGVPQLPQGSDLGRTLREGGTQLVKIDNEANPMFPILL